MLVVFALLPLNIVAQQRTEYNRKGDEAMKRLDYRDAKLWYEEGVYYCDPYSINQLTTIWLANEQMRPSLRTSMTKSLNCLNVMGTENDTTAISQLILFYTEGIGTPKSDELASYWNDQLEKLRMPAEPVYYGYQTTVRKPKEKMKFFLGYSYSIEAPVGLTVGGVVNKIGWYARFKTNLSFKDHSLECDDNGKIVPEPAGVSYWSNTKKSKETNCFIGTAGVVLKTAPWLYTSVGVGYGERTLLYPFKTMDYVTSEETDIWCKNIDSSYKGLAAEIDFMVKLGPVFFSAGCNTINFKYVDLNAGLGVFF